MKLRAFQLLLSIAFFTLGFAIMGFIAFNHTRLTDVQATTSIPVQTEVSSSPVEISIPSALIKVPVIEGSIDKGEWKLVKNAVLFLNIADSEQKNQATLIYGHDFKGLFQNLKQTEINDNIYVKTDTGEVEVYKVYSKESVKPTEVGVLSPKFDKELILYTCDGPLDTERVVIKAQKIN